MGTPAEWVGAVVRRLATVVSANKERNACLPCTRECACVVVAISHAYLMERERATLSFNMDGGVVFIVRA